MAGILLAAGGGLGVHVALPLALATLAVVARCRPRRRAAWLVVAAVPTAALVPAAQLVRAERDAVHHSFDATLEARVCAAASDSIWLRLELCQVRAVDSPEPLPARVLVVEAADAPAGPWLAGLREGERVRLRARLRPTRGLRNPGRPDRGRRLERRGIGARAALVDPAWAVRLVPRGASATGPAAAGAARPPSLRAGVSARLAASGEGGPLLQALAVGERGGLSPETRAAFRRLGVGHVLAVSGLHLALVTGLAFALARAALVRVPWWAEARDVRVAALACAVGAAAVYASLAGWGVPVQRALVFVSAGAATLALGRRRAAPHLFAAAVIVVLARDPAALFEPGAQLSFAASAGLLAALSRPAPDASGGRLARLGRGLRSSLATTAVAVAATAPVLAAHGGAAATPMALAANAVVVPWVGFALLPAALGAAGLTAAGVGAPAVHVAERLAAATLAAVEEAAERVPDWPERAAAPPAVVAVAAAGAVAVARVRRLRWRVALALAVLLGLRAAPASDVAPGAPRLVAFDVGHGDAVLVQSEHTAILVDAGSSWPGGGDLGRSVVVPGLRALGVERLALVVASHADIDHQGGLVSVLRQVPVSALWLPASSAADPAFDTLRSEARSHGVAVREVSNATPAVREGDVRIEVLWPPPALAHSSRNESSLALRLALGGRHVLLTGDLGEVVERRLLTSGRRVRADVLKVGHHGSATATSPAFLAAVAPRVAVVSAGCGDRRGLPHPAVLARLRDAGVGLGWTGRDGAVFVALSKAEPHGVGWGARVPCESGAAGRVVRFWRGDPADSRPRSEGLGEQGE